MPQWPGDPFPKKERKKLLDKPLEDSVGPADGAKQHTVVQGFSVLHEENALSYCADSHSESL